MLTITPTYSKDDLKDVIECYLDINKKITKIKLDRLRLEKRFKYYNFLHSPMAYDPDGVSYIRYPSFDDVVNCYIDDCLANDRILDVMQAKRAKFKPFWDSLSHEQQFLLANFLDDHLINLAIEKIVEIEKEFRPKYRF